MRAYLAAIAALAFTWPLSACSSNNPSSAGGDAAVASDGATTDGGAQGEASTNPPDASTGDSSMGGGDATTGKKVGDPCTSDSECPGDSQGPGKCETSWPNGGACTIVGCGVGDCPGSDTWCQPIGMQTYCAPLCQPGVTTCPRAGYSCIGGGCLPSSFAGDGG